jgi:hypothetical protein
MTFDRTDWFLITAIGLLMGAPVAVVLRMLGF